MSVLIVGAGPTGLALAIWLKTLKPTLKFRIVDKASGPGTTSRAIVIHARTLEYYRQLGLVDDFLAKGKVVEGISLFADGKVKGDLKFGRIGGDTTKYPFVTSLPQDEHERILIRRLDELGVSVEWSTEVSMISQTDEKVSVLLRGSEKVEVDYLAACDGAHSVVRKDLDVVMDGDKYPSRFYVADVSVSSDEPITRLRLCLGTAMFGVFLPLDRNDGPYKAVRVQGVVPSDLAEDGKFEDFAGRVADVIGLPIQRVNWSSIYRVYHRVSPQFRIKRVFLLGDAAHIHSPVGGQGMNTGLGDAANLAWKLVTTLNAGFDDGLLDTYDAERRGFAKKLIKTTDGIFHGLLDHGWKGFFIRRVFFARVLPWIWMIPFIPPRFFQIISQLGVSYRESTDAEEPAKGSLRAGDRLPWTGGEGVDNHAALETLRAEIHRYIREDNASAEKMTDSGLPVRSFTLKNPESFDLYPEYDYLIRPDGYISAISIRSR